MNPPAPVTQTFFNWSTLELLGHRLEHLLGEFQAFLGGASPEHPGQFFAPTLGREFFHGHRSGLSIGPFFDEYMMVRFGCNRGEVGDADHLTLL